MVSETTRSPRRWPLRTPGSHIERRDGRAFISDGDGSVVLAVNPSAAALWELCDGRTAIDEMVTAICELSSLRTEDVAAEVEATIKVFERASLLSLGSEPTSGNA